MYINNLKKIKLKRYFLPLIGLSGLVYFEEIRNYTYFPILIGFISFIFFWNFPYFVFKSISKPLYYEDLFLDQDKLPCYDVDNKIKVRFKTILKWTLITTSTLLTSALSDYYLYKTKNIKDNPFQILGVTGGLIKLFELINNLICKYILKILRFFIEKEKKKLLLEKQRINKTKLEKNIAMFENLNFDIEEEIEMDRFSLDIENSNKIKSRDRLYTI